MIGVRNYGSAYANRGQRMPIDAFFRSLAEDRGERAVAVILSGSGSDGALYPPIAANLTILMFQKTCADAVLHTRQRLRCRTSQSEPSAP